MRDIAAELFADRGFHETTMRDIAGRAGMLPGSIYYHFPSKADLLAGVYQEGVSRLLARIDAADPGAGAEPWARLEAVMTAHVAAILDRSAYARVMIRVLPDAAPGAAARLIEARDSYEARIAGVIAGLPLAPGIDRRLLRLFLLGAANHVQVWRREGGQSPAEIATALVRLLRDPARMHTSAHL
ncbi:MAG: TetR/AcrR family transcriptional regulator [Alphaproteobacteria bacterium]